jgi:hypothetical protein
MEDWTLAREHRRLEASTSFLGHRQHGLDQQQRLEWRGRDHFDIPQCQSDAGFDHDQQSDYNHP